MFNSYHKPTDKMSTIPTKYDIKEFSTLIEETLDQLKKENIDLRERISKLEYLVFKEKNNYNKIIQYLKSTTHNKEFKKWLEDDFAIKREDFEQLEYIKFHELIKYILKKQIKNKNHPFIGFKSKKGLYCYDKWTTTTDEEDEGVSEDEYGDERVSEVSEDEGEDEGMGEEVVKWKKLDTNEFEKIILKITKKIFEYYILWETEKNNELEGYAEHIAIKERERMDRLIDIFLIESNKKISNKIIKNIYNYLYELVKIDLR